MVNLESITLREVRHKRLCLHEILGKHNSSDEKQIHGWQGSGDVGKRALITKGHERTSQGGGGLPIMTVAVLPWLNTFGKLTELYPSRWSIL